MTRSIPAILLLILLPAHRTAAQEKKQDQALKREVTLYNPYKPSLTTINKISFLPDMTDTSSVRPVFSYSVSARQFQPEYTISPIKAAALIPDPLPKLYKSYVNLGFGTHITPLAEISLTNERSKKGAFGVYGRHYSTNDDITLRNGEIVYAGYMDNDGSLFGKRFIGKSILEGSVDFTQKVRYAYGSDPGITGHDHQKKDIKMNYYNLGAKASFSSMNTDSTEFFYDFDVSFNHFVHTSLLYQNNAGIEGTMAKSFRGFYAGSGISFQYYNNPDSTHAGNSFIASVSPFITKRSQQWNYKLGLQLLLDRNSILHIYPDLEFGFSIVPSYVSFFGTLNGKLVRNDPSAVIADNPFLVSDQFPQFVDQGILFRLPDTDHKLVVTSGLKGNTGIGGNYIISASYSVVDNMLFYSNIVFPDTVIPRAVGNYFMPVTDALNVLNFHAEMDGPVTEKLSFHFIADYYQYNSSLDHVWNKPPWNAGLGLKYHLRDKIIAGAELSATGKKWQVVNGDTRSALAGYTMTAKEFPEHFNLNLSAEYRYSKILSFWTRINNISFDDYYEWEFYPAQKFIFMLGFTYSL